MVARERIAWADHLLPTQLLPSLLDSGINTLFLSTSQQSNNLSELYREFDLEFSAPGTGLLTHTSSTKGRGGNSAISFPLSSGLHKETPLSIITQTVRESNKQVVGGGLTHTPGRLNPFVIPVLHAPSGAFSGSLDNGDQEGNTQVNVGRGALKEVLTGEEAGLVSVFQSRNNVRFGWAGLGMVGDEVFSAE